jgi:hypothetical protein
MVRLVHGVDDFFLRFLEPQRTPMLHHDMPQHISLLGRFNYRSTFTRSLQLYLS